ncbi:DUF4192 domain-containing protein [Tessaracoccus sp. MC1756]|uniref:DUF4192 domain-containing protein n=1 Tax=Tessaracoccus sp. MC1756 TaxID=2760311 RepID=UPI001602B49F|nr:DUF4192 domain-containing protein [Tessaracoccus sp. MC1756]MBB1510130.1 DUF4192 domain-containing protein [Tessaracoccus sp. MC1756]
MHTLPVLRGTTRADLLALPSFMFGFHPSDSVVLLGMQGKMVSFSSRLEAKWFRTHFDRVAEQMLNVTSHVHGVRFILLGYSEDLDLAWASVMELADVLGAERVAEALVTDGSHYWSLTDDEGPVEYDFDASPVAAHAVYNGVSIYASREEAVAPVQAWEPPAQSEVDRALAEIAGFSEAEGLARLEALAEAQTPLEDGEGLMLACLLDDEDRSAALTTRLNTSTAEVIWHNLLAARRVTPRFVQPTVVALLGIASWLSGHGAQATACIEQMAALNPTHPIGMLLTSVHQHGIPPQRWDE